LSARRDGIAHCARQEGRRYRLRRRAIDSAPFSSLVTGRASRFWSALRTDELSENTDVGRDPHTLEVARVDNHRVQRAFLSREHLDMGPNKKPRLSG